ncbi:MAG: universal stress protein [Natronospirillum sp.]|uniref:universal stress protein n=1 Tax=Natronospirillum sp. TaxID=2812955 RepID=UPI0025D81FDD|nr:universal stress protein [Natronospirillum sp.]MCH8551147.1 universal stress protein [Natronospirillum sp.]
MFKTILVPVSLSAELVQTQRALHAAITLSQLHTARLHILTVMPGFGSPWVAGYFPKPDMNKIKDEAYQQLRDIVKPVLPDSVDVKLKALDGTPYKRILQESERISADLIVIPSHSHNAMERTLLGSVAARVVERSKVSVLVVRPELP